MATIAFMVLCFNNFDIYLTLGLVDPGRELVQNYTTFGLKIIFIDICFYEKFREYFGCLVQPPITLSDMLNQNKKS